MKPFEGPHNKGPGRDDFGAGRVPDELIDAILDGEVAPTDTRAMFQQLSSDPDAADEMRGTRRAIGALRRPVNAPDFADRVLETVGRKRGGWLSGRDRRWVIGGRIAAAAAVLLVVGGLYTAERAEPGTLDVSNQPRALAGLADSVSNQSSRLAQETQQQMVCLGDSAFGVVQMFGAEAPEGAAGARVVFEWPFDTMGGSGEPPRMMVFSEQPISAASLAEHLSSITRQAGEAERSLRAGGTLQRFIDGLPKVVDRELITSIGEFASGHLLPASNTPPARSGGAVRRADGAGSMPILITLPGFDSGDPEDGAAPE